MAGCSAEIFKGNFIRYITKKLYIFFCYILTKSVGGINKIYNQLMIKIGNSIFDENVDILVILTYYVDEKREK